MKLVITDEAKNQLDREQCETITGHAELGATQSCLCGLKSYKPFPCRWCGVTPEEAYAEATPDRKEGFFCPTPSCPAFSNVVSLETWQGGHRHHQAVAKIPEDEPIFVLRGQDQLATAGVAQWITMAERKGVNHAKVTSAGDDLKAFNAFKQTHHTKLPD